MYRGARGRTVLGPSQGSQNRERRVILCVGGRCAPPLHPPIPPPHSACAAAWWCLPRRCGCSPIPSEHISSPPYHEALAPRRRDQRVEPPEFPLAVRVLSLYPLCSPIPRRRGTERRGDGLRVLICVTRSFHARLGSQVWMGRTRRRF